MSQQAGKFLNQGAALLAQGKINPAITLFKKAIKLDPRLTPAYFDLGLAYLQKDDREKAILAFKKTLQLNPYDFEAYNNLGNLYMAKRQLKKAESSFSKATQINPLLAEGFYNLGVCLQTKAHYSQAIRNYQKSLQLYPNNPNALNNLGVIYDKIGKPQQAVQCFKKAVKVAPASSMAWLNLGTIYIDTNTKKARKYFQKAVETNPDLPTAHYNLGVALRILRETEESIKCFEKTILLNPNFAPAYGQLYHQLKELCAWEKAKELLSKMKALSDKMLRTSQLPAETPFVSVVYDENPKRNYQITQAWSKFIQQKVAPFYQPYSFEHRRSFALSEKTWVTRGGEPHCRGPLVGGSGAAERQDPLKNPLINNAKLVHKGHLRAKIRVGYLSNDFRDHATSHLIMGLLRLHDRKKFKIYTYSYGQNDQSPYRRQIEKITRFRDILEASHRQAADLIYKDKIDILVDLKGHTTCFRLEIPALKPAPIQVNYLGFPGTSAATFFDYFITDKIVTPSSCRRYYSEKLVFLPFSYQVNDNQQPIAPQRFTRKQFHLPEKAFVFASFNQPYKINQELFSLWLKILKKTPQSVLWLLGKNSAQIKNLLYEAGKAGITSQRIIFSPALKKDEHLKRLSLADLSLDTFPCNGMTTTSDSLWANVPVLTQQGRHFASRVSASLLTAIGLPKLIAQTPAEYEKLALNLAQSPQVLKLLKEKLAKNRLTQPLFDTQKFVANLEKAYSKMWEIYTSGGRPRDLDVAKIK